ncbi:MAG: amidohydrolase family protein, partial [bacterium]
LQEIKVAALTAQHDGADLSAERLVRAATSDAMTIAGWGDKLGKIAPEYFADLLVLDRKLDDPYENLVAATEREVRLVIIAGHARHGDKALMLEAGVPAARLEDVTIGGRPKALNLQHPSSPINNVGFASAKKALEDAMADLHATRDAAVFEPLAGEGFIEVELDMQSPEPEPGEFEVLAEVELPQSVQLDAPTLIDDDAYWAKLDSIAHLPAFLKGPGGLRRFYKDGG